ncbi:MAG: ABC transporter ATP-binding protein [Candidatus Enteromonas sp.]|nr:ABC transporter ATP-binding protein [Candidatus Enteromonas sp.]MDY5299188.1 ABC transporter ATP-binding protein [Candidatus Enteromonas sp.]
MKNFKALKKYLRGSYGIVVLSFVFALLSVAAKMAVPFVTGLGVDVIRAWMKNPMQEDRYSRALLIDLVLMIGLILCGTVFRYFFDFTTAYVGQRLVKKMRDDVYIALNEVPVSYLDRNPHGDLLLRLTNDIENVQTGLITGAGALYEGIVQILITIVFMFYLNYFLGLVVVILTPLSILTSRFISKHNAQYFKLQNEKLGQITAFSSESITNLEAIQSYGLEERKAQGFDEKNLELKGANFKATFAASWINPSTRLVNNIIYGSVILLGVWMILESGTAWSWLGISFSVGSLSSFLTYSYQYMTPFNEIADAASDIFYADASLGRVMETLTTPKDIDMGNRPLGQEVQTLEAKDMVFSYDGKRTIIQRFNLDIYKGHKIALVGTTGCGKTTIINLLMRFYDPQQGGFYMNGIPTQEVSKKEMRSHIGMVLQETWLSKDTIAANIAFGKPNATMEEIVEAAKKAHADEFIRRMPEGYQTVVSNATGLSTGEKQLLCVARILLVQPEIVLLDEATSNIDLRTELALGKAFDELMRGKTSIVVAHRLSTIKNADLILVMKDGAVLEQGNFGELMAKNGAFADLYRSQLA